MNLKYFFYKYILNKKYYRYGKCNRCGACCTNIYIRHKNSVIKTKEQFFEILKNDPTKFYKQIQITGVDDLGVTFKCSKYNSKEKKCNIHFFRPLICRKYPSEEIFKFNAILSPECGFKFKPIDSFSKVLDNLQKRTM